MRGFLASLIILSLIVAPLSAAKIPRPAKELKIRLPGGEQLKLSDFKGKAVVIEFIQTTCPDCKRCCRNLVKLYEEFNTPDLQPLIVVVDHSPDKNMIEYTEQQQLKFPIGWTSRAEVSTFLQHSVTHLLLVPQLAFVDKQGTIRGQVGGPDEFFQPDKQEANLRFVIKALLEAE